VTSLPTGQKNRIPFLSPRWTPRLPVFVQRDLVFSHFSCLPLFSASLHLCERHKLFLSPARYAHSSRKDRQGVQLNIILVLGLSRTSLLRFCLPLFYACLSEHDGRQIPAAQQETHLLSLFLGYLALTVRNLILVILPWPHLLALSFDTLIKTTHTVVWLPRSRTIGI